MFWLKSLLNEECKKAIENPDWETKQLCHNWCNYVPHEVKDMWDVLNKDARIVAYTMAQVRAEQEEWD
jgi:hypothetical protein